MPTQTLQIPVDTTQQDKTYDDGTHICHPVYFPNGDNPSTRNGGHPFAQSLDWDAIEALEATLVEEDDEPVDGIFSEKQQRLSTHPLHSSWRGPGNRRPFVAMANVGLFYDIQEPPIVPDALLSVGVSLLPNVSQRGHRSYTYWRYNKPPEVAIEIVSNQKGYETTRKRIMYAKAKVLYYIVFDHDLELQGDIVQVNKLHEEGYREHTAQDNVWWLPEVNLGLTLWYGFFEDMEALWLRWCYANGLVVPTGEEMAQRERSEKERERSEKERERSEKERALQQVEQGRKENERLAAKLRALGIDPDA